MLNRRMTTKREFRGARRRRNRGFSIIELLVAIIIIGILVAVLVPVISNRTEQARQSTARADLDNLATQQERAAVDSGFYIRLFALNDQLRGDGIPFNRDQNDNNRVDGLTDYLVATHSTTSQRITACSSTQTPGISQTSTATA